MKDCLKNHRRIAIAAVCCLFFGLLGGLIEYIGPTIRVDENELNPQNDDVRASVTAPAVSASGAILIDGQTGDVLYEKNADGKLYPASTTKILTALVALETLDELDLDISAEVVVPKEAVGVEGSSMYLRANEKITIEELLYGLMLQSGNDSAVAIGICIGGDLSNFVDMMNQKASELGCSGSHFVNPNGLFDDNHYTTARDMAIIAAAAMERDDFRTIVAAKSWKSPTSSRSFVNKNKTVSQYEGATGVKIGFTKKSGRTLVASAKRGDKEMIAVVLQDGNWFNDAYALMDYGFELLDIE